MSDQEARDFGISTDQICLEMEHIFYHADDDVLRYTMSVDFRRSRSTGPPGTAPTGTTPPGSAEN